VYGDRTGTLVSDLTALERVEDYLTLDHRIIKVHACVEITSDGSPGRLNGVMLTVGDKITNENDFNLNQFGELKGQCDSFIISEKAQIIKLEIAYTPTAVTAIQVGTDTNR
jgi:hypothetical protein